MPTTRRPRMRDGHPHHAGEVSGGLHQEHARPRVGGHRRDLPVLEGGGVRGLVGLAAIVEPRRARIRAQEHRAVGVPEQERLERRRVSGSEDPHRPRVHLPPPSPDRPGPHGIVATVLSHASTYLITGGAGFLGINLVRLPAGARPRRDVARRRRLRLSRARPRPHRDGRHPRPRRRGARAGGRAHRRALRGRPAPLPAGRDLLRRHRRHAHGPRGRATRAGSSGSSTSRPPRSTASPITTRSSRPIALRGVGPYGEAKVLRRRPLPRVPEEGPVRAHHPAQVVHRSGAARRVRALLRLGERRARLPHDRQRRTTATSSSTSRTSATPST